MTDTIERITERGTLGGPLPSVGEPEYSAKVEQSAAEPELRADLVPVVDWARAKFLIGRARLRAADRMRPLPEADRALLRELCDTLEPVIPSS